MSSINYNHGATTALATLRSINKNFTTTQNQISTGKQVASAKDNAAYWSISKSMEGDAGGLKAVNDSLSSSGAAVNVARVGAEKIVDLMKQMKEKLTVAVNANDADRVTIQTDISELQKQITSTIDASQFNGQNYLKNATPAAGFISSLNRDGAGAVKVGYITVDDQSTNVTGATDTTTGVGTYDVTTAGNAATHLEDIDNHISAMTSVAAVFGQAGNRIDEAKEFNKSLVDALNSGVSAITDADMEETSAKLQALQVQQQLATQSLSMANQAPQNILSLFR